MHAHFVHATPFCQQQLQLLPVPPVGGRTWGSHTPSAFLSTSISSGPLPASLPLHTHEQHTAQQRRANAVR